MQINGSRNHKSHRKHKHNRKNVKNLQSCNQIEVSSLLSGRDLCLLRDQRTRFGLKSLCFTTWEFKSHFNLLGKLLLGLTGAAISRRTILSAYPVLSALSALGTDSEQTWHFTPHPRGQQLRRTMTFTGTDRLYIDYNVSGN